MPNTKKTKILIYHYYNGNNVLKSFLIYSYNINIEKQIFKLS